MGERTSLEFEVNYHRARIAELEDALRDIEEDVARLSDPPPGLLRQAEAIRMELKGRSFAVAVGSSRLMTLPPEEGVKARQSVTD
jgi:TolA-binding protein